MYGIDFRTAIIVLSFVTTILVSYVAFMNPAVRWQQLRVAALQIESNIWMFRTRSGKYRSNREGFDSFAEKILIDELQGINSFVLEGADVKGTSFYSQSTSKNLHKQHNPNSKVFGPIGYFVKGASVDTTNKKVKVDEPNKLSESFSLSKSVHGESEIPLTRLISHLRDGENENENEENDLHYEPLHPDAYVRFRILPAMEFYKSRIPINHFIRSTAQMFLILGSISIGALAFFNQSAWASGATIISSAISGFLEFDGTVSKVQRYSTTISALNQTILWWQTLPQIETSATANVDHLIVTCEDILLREQQAWKSTTQAVKVLSKTVGLDSTSSEPSNHSHKKD